MIGFFNHQVDSEKGDANAEWSVSQVLQVIRSESFSILISLLVMDDPLTNVNYSLKSIFCPAQTSRLQEDVRFPP